MIAALDSATPPTPAQVDAARQGGVQMWNGYLATKAGVGLAHPWSDWDFEVVKALPAQPIGYCSGWDSPAACRAKASALGIKLCLDVESGIRGDGTWVQPWLDASGAGLYGLLSTQQKYRAPWRVMAGYVAVDPGRTWQGPAPAEPHAWQWQNSHNEFGVTIDRCWFDDWFGGSTLTPAQETQLLADVAAIKASVSDRNYRAGFDQIYNGVLAWQQQNPGAALPQNVQDALVTIAKHLQ